jgi:hypothetical protein
MAILIVGTIVSKWRLSLLRMRHSPSRCIKLGVFFALTRLLK